MVKGQNWGSFFTTSLLTNDALKKNCHIKALSDYVVLYTYLYPQPTMVVCKTEVQSENVLHIAYSFLRICHRLVCSVGACQQNFCIGAQSVGSLLRVRCWLGRSSTVRITLRPIFLPTATATYYKYFHILLLLFFFTHLPTQKKRVFHVSADFFSSSSFLLQQSHLSSSSI